MSWFVRFVILYLTVAAALWTLFPSLRACQTIICQ